MYQHRRHLSQMHIIHTGPTYIYVLISPYRQHNSIMQSYKTNTNKNKDIYTEYNLKNTHTTKTYKRLFYQNQSVVHGKRRLAGKKLLRPIGGGGRSQCPPPSWNPPPPSSKPSRGRRQRIASCTNVINHCCSFCCCRYGAH